MLKYNLKAAFRNLFQFKSHSILSLAGLIIGLACVIAIAAWTIQELQYDKFHLKSESIYMVTTNVNDNNGNISTFPETPPPLAAKLKERIPDIESSSHFIYLYGGRLIKIEENSYKEKGIAADSNFFEIFDFQLIEGDPNCLEQPNSILLTEKLAKKLFANEAPIGKDVIYRKSIILTVKGIIKNVPENSSIKFDFIVPYKIEIDNPNNWWQLSDATFIKIASDKEITRTKQMATEIWKEKFTDGQYNINFIPLIKLRYGAKFEFFNAEHGNTQKLYAFIGIAILILFLACLNYTNLVSAYSINKIGEVRIRKVNGASSNNILKYFLTASIIDSIIAGLLAAFLSILFVHLFQIILDIEIALKYLIISCISGILGSLIIVGLISGLYPALITSSSLPFVSKNQTNNSLRYQNKFRNAFILGQFILSITLTIVSLVFIRQINYLNNYNVGYNADNVVLIHMPTSGVVNYQTIKNNLLADSNIEQVCFAGSSPVNIHPLFSTENWSWAGLAEGTPTSIFRLNVDQNYLDIFQIPLLKGRFFSTSEAEKNDVVINEKLADILGFDNPMGKIISRGEDRYEIIGVVKNFHFQNLSNNIHPLLFMYSATKNRMFVKTSHNREQSLNLIKEQYSDFFNEQPFSYRFVDDDLNELYLNEKKISLGIIVFTIMTIFLSCIGLIGLVTFNIDMKTKEIGIRKVCGAEINEILVLLNKNVIVCFFIGVAVSSILSWYAMDKWLQNFTYKVKLDWWLFVSGALIIMVIATLTVSWQTWKAATKNPVDALKYE